MWDRVASVLVGEIDWIENAPLPVRPRQSRRGYTKFAVGCCTSRYPRWSSRFTLDASMPACQGCPSLRPNLSLLSNAPLPGGLRAQSLALYRAHRDIRRLLFHPKGKVTWPPQYLAGPILKTPSMFFSHSRLPCQVFSRKRPSFEQRKLNRE